MLSCFGESFFQRFSNAISKVEFTRVTSRREYGVQWLSELLVWSGAPRSRVRAHLVAEAMTVSLGMSGSAEKLTLEGLEVQFLTIVAAVTTF